MIHLNRVASEIKSVGLYDLILQDVQRILGRTRVSQEEIQEVISSHPEVLEEYKQTNVEYNVSNIHLRDIEIDTINEDFKQEAKEINENLATLRELEKYTLDFEHSATLVIIFSIEFIVLFSVQYFIILLNLKAWQWELYGFFSLSIVVAYMYAKVQRKKYEKNAAIFYELYDKTVSMIDNLEEVGAINSSDLIIKECDEHV